MYFISILAIIAVTLIASGSSNPEAIIDAPSLVIVLLICIPMLISSGLLKDFNNAFRIALNRKKEAGLIEIKRAIEAIGLTIHTLFYSAFFLFAISLIAILRSLSDLASLGPNLAVAFLTCIYSLALALMLLPIKSILTVRAIEFMQQPEDETIQEETE